MKHFAFSFAFLLCAGLYGYGQTCPVKSNPTTWDWRGSGDYTFYLYGSRYNSIGGVVKKKSPWFDINTNENVASFRFQTPKDYEPSGGWVLVQRDFGAPGRFINHPYFILYNKYTGIMRIFVAISETIAGYNSALITLKYADNSRRTAVLGFYGSGNYISPTKNFENNVSEIMVGNSYAYDLPYWLHADFVMNYDPCTCNVSNPNLQFTVKLVSKSNMKFRAEGALTPKDNMGRASDGKLGFSGVFTGATKVVKSANDTYTNSEKAIKNIQTIAKGSEAVKKAPWELLNFVPGLGFALGLVDGLVGVFDKSTSSATKPTAYKMKFEMEGELITKDSQRPVYLNIPGSSINIVPPTNITYNNTLGVFTLLEKPTVVLTNVAAYEEYDPGSDYSYTTYKNRMVLVQNLRYAMNPAISSSFSEFKIQTRIEIDRGYGYKDASSFVDYSCFKPALTYEYFDDNISISSSKVFLKVAVKYKVGNNEAVFMARYPVTLVSSNNYYGGCFTGSLATSNSAMTALCGSTDYKNRANQYYRTGNSYEKVSADQTNLEEETLNFAIFPNPSSGNINFEYNIKESDNVHIYITDLMGKRVLDVVSPQFQTSGKHLINFDLTAERRLSPGIYLCRFRTGAEEVTRKLVLQN